MEYSIIIPYRNRKTHLEILFPRLQEIFANEQYEIIISEQDDDDKFQKNSLYNIAAQYASGKLLVFHDVDYYPIGDISYYTETDVPYYPVGKVYFLDESNQLLDHQHIPAGYQNFHNDVGDHSGGVFVLSKEIFNKTNGFNPYYKGWGKEDDDTRDRLRLLGYQWKRNKDNIFYALYHEHNRPSNDDPDFINNHFLLHNLKQNLKLGKDNVRADVDVYQKDKNIKWLKIKNFIYE